MTFHLFPKLPAELRREIWNDALPRKIGQAFFYYELGCWEPLQLTEDDEGFDPTHPTNIFQTYHHELLTGVDFAPSLLFVNREARAVARDWLLRQQDVDIVHHHHDSEKHEHEHEYSVVNFVCRFNTQRDCLYVDKVTLFDFLNEAVERGFAADLLDKTITFQPAQIRFLALPIAILETEDINHLSAVLEDSYYCLEELWVVVGPSPSRQQLQEDPIVNRRWEVDLTADFDACQQLYNRKLDYSSNNNPEARPRESLQDLLARVKNDVSRNSSCEAIKNLVVRPVLAIGR